jgi:hypothetical protein
MDVAGIYAELMGTCLLPALLSAAIELLGTTQCPVPRAVAEALARLEPAGATAAPVGGADAAIAAELRDDGDLLVIALRSRDGKLTAERTLPRAGSCADLAAAAAVVIESWRGETRTDVAVEIPVPRPPEPAGVPEPAAEVSAPAPASAPRARRPWDVGVAGVTSLQGDLAPGLMVDGHYGWAGSSLAARLAVLATAAHARSLAAAPGQARWSRAALALGIRDRLWGRRNLMLDVHADAQLALIRLDGAGFDSSYTRNDFDIGIGGGLGLAWKPDVAGVIVAAPFLGIDGVAWPRDKTVVTQGPGGGQATLPWFELRAVAGVSFGRFL